MKKLYYLFRHVFGINALHRLLSKQCKPFVLCYHEVNEEELYSQLRALKEVFTIKNINQLQANDYGACAITLDDCLKRDAEIFYKVAESLSLPVTFYLPVNYCVEEQPLPGDLIKWMIQVSPKIQFHGTEWPIASPKEKLMAKNKLSAYFYEEVKKGKDISQLMLDVFQENKIPESKIPDEIKVIGPTRVAEMAKSEFVKFESHSISHPAFVNLNDADLKKELEDSARWIEHTTNQKVKSICYPFGSVELTGKRVYELSRDYYENGVTLLQDVWTNANKFEIPRIGLYPGDKNYGMWSKIFHYQDRSFIKQIFN
jgi:hypothetical protein